MFSYLYGLLSTFYFQSSCENQRIVVEKKIKQKFRFKIQSEKISSTLKSLTERQTEVDN